MKIKKFIQQETILLIAIILAVISSFFVPPDMQYIDYIDFRTLGILFSLMTVMAGLQQQAIFDRMGQALLAHTGEMFRLVLVLVGLCFFGSMFITNDVSLMTFVPFTFVVLNNVGEQMKHRIVIPVVCMQTIAANLGSMLTPIGNPQNLYLYGKSSMSIMQFIRLMLPYTIVSLLILVIWIFLLCRRKKGTFVSVVITEERTVHKDNKIVMFYAVLFVISLLAVVRVLSYSMVFVVALVGTFCVDRGTLRRVDYSLLLTFVAFFIFIGNLGRVPAFSEWLQEIISGREVLVAVMASQVTSNVPAALLLSGFTQNIEAIVIGTNLGGLGTLIASMASLISYRQIARELPRGKGRYFGLFTVSNIIFLVILLAVWFGIAK